MRVVDAFYICLITCFASCSTTKNVARPAHRWQIDSLPNPLFLIDSAKKVSVLSQNSLSITAGKGTDLHNPTSGAFRKHNAPKLLFTPNANFDFWVMVTPQFKNRYDGGALILFGDTANWAKLLFQYTGSGYVTGMSVVKQHNTDDSYYPAADSTAIYLRLKKVKDVCSFYTSANGQQWNLTRQFLYPFKKSLAVGFYVQSPVGDQCEVIFSHIQYTRL